LLVIPEQPDRREFREAQDQLVLRVLSAIQVQQDHKEFRETLVRQVLKVIQVLRDHKE